MKKVLLAFSAVSLAALGVLGAAACLSPAKLLGLTMVPSQRYRAARAPAPPDYRATGAWAALPDREDAADLVPAGVSPGDRQAEAQVDVFFVHPTTYYRRDRWNAPLADPRSRAYTDLTLATQASAFNGCCRVYAPLYRQATLGAFFSDREDAAQAMRLAYLDVATAFAHYLAHLNQGRPFLLAAHSQGSMHGMRLLEELEASPARERLVAAYLPGYRLASDRFERVHPHIGPCTHPTQTGCVVAWDSYAEHAAEGRGLQGRQWYGAALEQTQGKELHCTNPISWTTDDQPAPAAQHRGSVGPVLDRPFPGAFAFFFDSSSGPSRVVGLEAPAAGRLSARCSKGKLLVTPPAGEDWRGRELGEGSLHNYDYWLFYQDVRENAQARVEAYLAAHQP